ncbi:hypothetical protein L9F63_000676, partial [Diploptera punctata]
MGPAVDCMDGVDPETAGFDIRLCKVKGVGKGSAKKNELSEQFGPIPPSGSRIFAGKCFLLTNTDVKIQYSMEEDSSSGADMTDYEEPKIKFSKSYLTKQIQGGGGEVYLRFEDVPPNRYKDCYLVANKPSHTALFILCLAHGIPIICNEWIAKCCKDNTCPNINAFQMPTGYSLEKKEFKTRVKSKPLHGMKIGLVSDVKIFIKFWKKVVEAAGASVTVISKPMKEMEELDVLIPYQCPFEIEKHINELGKPLVTTTWVTQCLVNVHSCMLMANKLQQLAQDGGLSRLQICLLMKLELPTIFEFSLSSFAKNTFKNIYLYQQKYIMNLTFSQILFFLQYLFVLNGINDLSWCVQDSYFIQLNIFVFIPVACVYLLK